MVHSAFAVYSYEYIPFDLICQGFLKFFIDFYKSTQKIFVETCEITSYVNKMHIFL